MENTNNPDPGIPPQEPTNTAGETARQPAQQAPQETVQPQPVENKEVVTKSDIRNFATAHPRFVNKKVIIIAAILLTVLVAGGLAVAYLFTTKAAQTQQELEAKMEPLEELAKDIESYVSEDTLTELEKGLEDLELPEL